MSRPAYLHCIYAEDVRREINEQISIIGVYQGGLKLQFVPAQIAKLVVVGMLFIPKETPPSKIVFEISKDGVQLQSVEPPEDFLTTARNDPEFTKNGGFTLQVVVGFAGLNVESAGKIDVRAVVDGIELQGNSLQVAVEPGQ